MSQGWGLVLSCNDGSESWYVYGSYVDGRGVGDPNERLRVGPRTTSDVGRPVYLYLWRRHVGPDTQKIVNILDNSCLLLNLLQR